MINLHVMLSPDGHWDVKDAEDGELLSHHGERDEAVTAAVQLAKERKGAEVRIHDPEGGISSRAEVDAEGEMETREGIDEGEGVAEADEDPTGA